MRLRRSIPSLKVRDLGVMAVDSREEFEKMISNATASMADPSAIVEAAKDQSTLRKVSDEALDKLEKDIKQQRSQDK